MPEQFVLKIKPDNKYTDIDDYRLLSMVLIGRSGQKLDLKPLFQNFTFVEDIFKCSLTGSVILKDAVNLRSTFPMEGYEILEIEFKTPGIGSEYIKKSFRVIEVTDNVKSEDQRKEVYRLTLISDSAFNDKTKNISKSYKGKISDIAKKIYSEYIKTTKKDNPLKPLKYDASDLNVQETLGEQKYVIPRWSPFRALLWLAKRAIPAKRSSETNYLFYEDADRHNFITLSELVSANSVMTYYNIPANTERDLSLIFSKTRDVNFLKTNQKLKEQIQGSYSSTLYVHDVTTKQWGKYIYNYNDDEGKVRYITDNKLTKNNTDVYTTKPDSAFHLTTKQTGLMGKDFPDVQNHKDWLQRSISSNILLDSVSVKITTCGNSLLRAGKVIEFFTPKSSFEDKVQDEWYDTYYSGRYLITTLRHTITQDGYTNTMLLAKNSYEQPTPDKSSFLGTGNK